MLQLFEKVYKFVSLGAFRNNSSQLLRTKKSILPFEDVFNYQVLMERIVKKDTFLYLEYLLRLWFTRELSCMDHLVIEDQMKDGVVFNVVYIPICRYSRKGQPQHI